MPTTPVLGATYPTPLDPATADIWGDILNALFLVFDGEFGTRTVDQNFADKILSRPKFKDPSETVYSVGNISGAVTLDYVNGSYQYATLTGNVSSLTINNFPASGAGGWMTLEFIQDGTGGHTLTLGGAYVTAGNDTVVLSTAASAVDVLYLQTRDAGATIRVTPTYSWS